METSKAIKTRQYTPIKGIRNGHVWTFTSERNPNTQYTTRRVTGQVYTCNCPAPGLCKHITSALLDDAGAKWELVQVWTSQADAARQHRRTVQMFANNRKFWVTYANKVEEITTKETTREVVTVTGPRSVTVEFLWDRMTPPTEMDVWLVRKGDTTVNGRPARLSLDEILNTPGWVHGKMVMVQGNARPGYHRFRVELREIV